MHTYVKTEEGFAAIRASRRVVCNLQQVQSGRWAIVPATRHLREAARLNVNVKTYRVLGDGTVGYL